MLGEHCREVQVMWGIGLFSGYWKAHEVLGEFSIIYSTNSRSDPHSSPEGGGKAPKTYLPTARRR